MSGTPPTVPPDYADWLADIKTRVVAARARAVLAANAELIRLYWQIGCEILTRQTAQGWGSKVIERLARDLRAAFPDMKGFSRRNLMYMRDFAEAWPDEAIVQQAAAQLPWFHNVLLLTKLKDPALRLRYAEQAVAGGWSRATLEVNLRNQWLERQGQAVTNFAARLPAPHSALAHETLKTPICSIFSAWAMPRTSARSKTRWCGTSPGFCWSWAAALLSWGSNSGSRSVIRRFSSTCCSTTRGSSAMWWLNSRQASSSPNTPGN